MRQVLPSVNAYIHMKGKLTKSPKYGVTSGGKVMMHIPQRVSSLCISTLTLLITPEIHLSVR